MRKKKKLFRIHIDKKWRWSCGVDILIDGYVCVEVFVFKLLDLLLWIYTKKSKIEQCLWHFDSDKKWVGAILRIIIGLSGYLEIIIC